MEKYRRLSFITVLALPWIWPIAFGPWAEAMPWLFSLGASSFIIALWRSDQINTHDIALSFCLASVVSVIPAVVQYFGYSELDFFWPWIRSSVPGNAIGNIGQPNQQATLFVIGLISICWLYSEGSIAKNICAVLSLFVVAGLALTASRTGMLNLFFAISVIFWISGKDKKFYIYLSVVVVAFYFLASFISYKLAIFLEIENARNIFSRVSSGGGGQCHSRAVLWDNVFDIIELKPWQGWGWNNLRYAQYVTDFSGERWCEVLGNAHNLPLHLAATLGVPVALLILILFLFTLKKGRPWTESDRNKKFAWAILIPIAIHSMLEFPLWYGPFQIIVVISIFLIFFDKKIQSKKWMKYSFSGVFFILSVWGFFDYWRVTQVYLPPELRIAELQSDLTLDKTLIYSSKTVFFPGQAMFATVAFVEPDKNNAIVINKMANELLRFSPEPRVIRRLLESAWIIGDKEQFEYHKKRFEVGYPKEYKKWDAESAGKFN